MYSRKIEDEVLTFGVSGMLYKANVLMYDRQTESLWSQARRAAVTGPMTGTELEVLPSSLTSWRKWRQRHPQTEVLSLDTGYERNYSRDPYADYYASKKGFFRSLRRVRARKKKPWWPGSSSTAGRAPTRSNCCAPKIS